MMKTWLVAISAFAIVSAAADVIGSRQLFHQTEDNNLIRVNDRQLQDFDRFNELFQGASINIPYEFEVSEKIALITLTLWINNIRCYNISVGDIVLNHTKIGTPPTDIDVTVDVSELDMSCDIDYRYNYGVLRGSGVAQVFTDNNSASTTLRFTSDDYSVLPPSTSSIQDCTSDISIVNMAFHGDFASDIVELFEERIRGLVEQQVEGVVCTELGSLGTTFVDDMLQIADKTLQGFQNQALNESVTNPLYQETTADLPTDLVPLNLQDTESIVGRMFSLGLQAVDNLLGGVVADPSGPNDSDLGINVMLRSTFLDDERALVVDIDQLGINPVVFQGHDKLTESTITINQVKVFGLDTLTRFDPLTPIGENTLHNELSWDFLTLELDVTVDIKPSSLEDAILQDATSEGISERIQISFGVEDIEVDASLYLVIDQSALGDVQLGSLLFMENLLPCFMSVIHNVQLSELSVDPQTIATPTLEGFVSPGLDRLITGAVETAFDMYSGALANTIPTIFQTSVRNFVNNEVITPFLRDEVKTKSCPQASNDTDGFVDFRKFFDSSNTVDFRKLFDSSNTEYGPFPSMFKNLLDTELLDVDVTTGRPKVNKVIIDPLTHSQSGVKGTFEYDGNLFDTGTSISVGGLNADIKLRASDLKIENLNSLSDPLALLDPVQSEPYYLNNTATMGLEEQPLRVSTRFLFEIDSDDENPIKNDLGISLDMNAANVIVTAMLKVANSRLFSFPLRDVLDINCWIATIPPPLLDSRGVRLLGEEATAAIADLLVTVSQMNLNVTCFECTSPGMEDWTNLLSTKSAQEGATESANMVLRAFSTLATGDLMQVQIDRLLSEAAQKCPHSNGLNATSDQYEQFETPQNESDTTFLMLLGGVTLGLIAALIILMVSIGCIVRRRHRWWLSQLPEEQIKCLRIQQKKDDTLETKINSDTTSIFRSNVIPCLVRWGMPLIILGNIGLFLSGHLSLGATVNIEASIAGQTLRVEEFFEFSMAKSTIDIWNAGGEELAVLILIFSGIWPYTKQLITLALWFMPPSWVSISRRGSILLWLDWLAKWSMIDIFVLVISIAAFRVSIQSPDVAFLPEGFYSIDLLVVPLWGLYANMLAQLVSQISSHFILHYHRKIYNNARTEIMERYHLRTVPSMALSKATSSFSQSSYDGRRLLKKHRFGRPHRGEQSQKLIVRDWISYALPFACISLVIFFVIGCFLPSFSLDIQGLVGVAVESGQNFEDATTYHSVFTVIQLLMEEARFLGTPSDYIGLGALSALFVFTVLAVPILQSFALLRQWFSPLTVDQRSRMSVITEILQAWQYAEVYLIAIFVASWQLGPISEFMINSYCDSLEGFFGQMVFFGLLKEEDAQCFSVKSSIENGAYILAAGAITLALLNTFITKAVTQYLREKAELERQADDQSDSLELEDEAEDPKKASDSSQIRPTPVLFTDTFRWLLRADNTLSSPANGDLEAPEGVSSDAGSWDGEEMGEKVCFSGIDAIKESGAEDNNDEGFVEEYTTISLDTDSKPDKKPRHLHSTPINNRPDKGDVGVL